MVNYLGETITIRATIKDEDGNLIDPSTVTCKIVDPTGRTRSSGNMTRISLGVYEYDWQSSATDSVGTYLVLVSVVVQAKTTIEVYRFIMHEPEKVV